MISRFSRLLRNRTRSDQASADHAATTANDQALSAGGTAGSPPPSSEFTASCPHCETRFRLDLAMLERANCLLRCGSCMQIFTASEELQRKMGIDVAPQSAAESEVPAPVQTAEAPPVNPPETAPQSAAQNPSAAPTTPAADTATAKTPEPSTPNSAETAKAAKTDTAQAARPDPRELIESLSTLNHDFEHHQPRRRRRWPWLLLIALALLALTLQLLWGQRDKLYNSPLGPQLESLCADVNRLVAIPCEKTAGTQAQPADIITRNLIIRRHPDVDNALRVDAILLNREAQPQPFPPLRLRFSDINGEEIASRLFQPEEYLAGEVAPDSPMQSQQPIRVALEIVDPGSAAVSYELRPEPAPR